MQVAVVVNPIFGRNSWEYFELKIHCLAVINFKRKEYWQYFVIAPLFWEAENSNWVRDPKLGRRPQKLGLWNFRLLKWWRAKISVPCSQLIQCSFWSQTNVIFAQLWIKKSIIFFFFFLIDSFRVLGLLIFIFIFIILLFCSSSWVQKFCKCNFIELLSTWL